MQIAGGRAMLGAVRDLASQVATYAGGKSVAATVADEVVAAAEAAIAATRDDGTPIDFRFARTPECLEVFITVPARADARRHAPVARARACRSTGSHRERSWSVTSARRWPNGRRVDASLQHPHPAEGAVCARRPGNQVRMYACGLTVYARGHIGNFRTFLVPRRPAPHAEVRRRPRRAPGRELHRRRRQDHRRRRARGRAARPSTPSATSRPSTRTARRSASSRRKRTRAPPTRPTSRRWPT